MTKRDHKHRLNLHEVLCIFSIHFLLGLPVGINLG